MRKLQTSYNANKIVKQVKKEKGAIKNTIFSIDLVMVSSDIKQIL